MLELNQIYIGDARELALEIPDNSIDLILTDPVYENIDDYAWLAELAMRVLKPNSACLAFQGTRCCADSQKAMEATGLVYQWTLYYTIPGKPGAKHLYGLYPCTTPVLYFAKGRRKASPYLPDTIVSHADSDNSFEWQKNKAIITRYIESFSKPGDTVLDPFTGSGTIPTVCKEMGRNYIGFEINPARAEMARQRAASAQPPLFILDEEVQTTMDIAG